MSLASLVYAWAAVMLPMHYFFYFATSANGVTAK